MSGSRLLLIGAITTGLGGGWTPHDLRRTGATMMGELGVMGEGIERCLNHVTRYEKMLFRQQKTDVELHGPLAGNDVIVVFRVVIHAAEHL
jgi:hypothetical protein